MTAHEKMDRMYRYQRYFYDFTRKYYLLGRDSLIDDMAITAGESILEIGCGTGRNLLILAKQHPEANFYGLDASAEMLNSAVSKIEKNKATNIELKTALADDFDYGKTFKLEQEFDKIYFSYSISMIPAWRNAIENALKNLKKGGSLFIVDFYDQRDLPSWFSDVLKRWLRRFHVKYPQELIPHLDEFQDQGKGNHSFHSVYGSYAFISHFKKV